MVRQRMEIMRDSEPEAPLCVLWYGEGRVTVDFSFGDGGGWREGPPSDIGDWYCVPNVSVPSASDLG